MEQVILQCLEFDLVSPTIHTFLVRCLRAVEADVKVDQLSHVRHEAILNIIQIFVFLVFV